MFALFLKLVCQALLSKELCTPVIVLLYRATVKLFHQAYMQCATDWPSLCTPGMQYSCSDHKLKQTERASTKAAFHLKVPPVYPDD